MFMHVDREDHVHTSFQCRLLDKVGYRVREAAVSVAATKKSATYEQQQQQHQHQHQHHRVCTSDPTRKTTCFSLILSPRILTTTTTRTTIYRSVRVCRLLHARARFAAAVQAASHRDRCFVCGERRSLWNNSSRRTRIFPRTN